MFESIKIIMTDYFRIQANFYFSLQNNEVTVFPFYCYYFLTKNNSDLQGCKHFFDNITYDDNAYLYE